MNKQLRMTWHLFGVLAGMYVIGNNLILLSTGINLHPIASIGSTCWIVVGVFVVSQSMPRKRSRGKRPVLTGITQKERRLYEASVMGGVQDTHVL